MTTNEPPDTHAAGTPLLAKYAGVFDRIAAGAIERERERRLPFEEMGWLKAAGFASVRVPKEQGGDGASIVDLAQLLIALATADCLSASAAWYASLMRGAKSDRGMITPPTVPRPAPTRARVWV